MAFEQGLSTCLCGEIDIDDLKLELDGQLFLQLAVIDLCERYTGVPFEELNPPDVTPYDPTLYSSVDESTLTDDNEKDDSPPPKKINFLTLSPFP